MTAEYWLAAAGETLFSQVNKRWPNRDRASDGWIGDASHAAVQSDHNPCWTCKGDHYGVVRAVDIDAGLSHDPKDTQVLANQLIRNARLSRDGGRLSYVIYNRQIASGTYAARLWEWRPYTGDDPHTSHVHVSFEPRGDLHGSRFDLPCFEPARVQRLELLLRALHRRAARLRARLRRIRNRHRR